MGNYSIIKGVPELLKKESNRVNNFQKNKYKTDEVYREAQKAKAKLYRNANKNKLVEV